MSRRINIAVVLLAFTLGLVGCASPGAPEPPSLRLPHPVEDLAATRKGNQVLLTWSPPMKTSDGVNIKHAGETLVCRSTDTKPMIQCGTPVATVKDAQVEHATRTSIVARHDYTDTLTSAMENANPAGFVTYTLEDQNPNSRSAGLSNQVKVPLAPTLPAPNGVQAKVTADGVLLGWTTPPEVPRNPALSYLYRVFRKNLADAKKPEVIVGEVNVGEGQPNFLDRNIDWEQKYAYRIATITRVQPATGEPIEVEGDDSPVADVAVHDVFAPAVPVGMQAVFSGVGQKPFIDLSWAPNLENDLAGYNVFRHESGTQPVKINTELVKTPSYRDANVIAGHEYFYAVSAMDVRGNESGKSEETSEKVPK